jgi:Holliday junction resolvasome RuvABC endonuclease subunit
MATKAKRMNVVALDLSLAATGWATRDGTGSVITKPADQLEARLERICQTAINLVRRERGESSGWPTVVIEDFVTRSPAASLLGMVHGAVRLELFIEFPVTAVLVPPASLKKYATGKGNATKADMRMALFQRAGVDERNDNAVDAAWLRFMALDALGEPLFAMPASHRAALTKVPWPDLAGEERRDG